MLSSPRVIPGDSDRARREECPTRAATTRCKAGSAVFPGFSDATRSGRPSARWAFEESQPWQPRQQRSRNHPKRCPLGGREVVHRHDLRLRGPHPDVAPRVPERAPDPGEGRRAERRGRVHRRGRRRRPGGLSQVRPDGQRHDLGPWRLSRAGFLRADAARPRLVPRGTDCADAVSERRTPTSARTRRRPSTERSPSAFKTNRYDAATSTLTLPDDSKAAFNEQVAYWTNYFADPAKNGGLSRGAVADPIELRKLTAFFVWTAWASAAQRPGSAHSYTNNFPYDPLVGNHHTGGALLWSAISLVFLLGGIAVVLLAFGKFDYLGWHGGTTAAAARPASVRPAQITPAQAATVKFMVVAGLLFLAQVLIGGALAHYRAEPGDFYGFDLSAVFPSNLLRAWHLQTMIFWVATSYVAGALFVASALGGGDPKGQRPLVHLLFWAVVVVVVGSLLGQWAGINNLLGELWFWIGNQGWEYLEIGRFWQILLAAGLLFWFWLVLSRGRSPFAATPSCGRSSSSS